MRIRDVKVYDAGMTKTLTVTVDRIPPALAEEIQRNVVNALYDIMKKWP